MHTYASDPKTQEIAPIADFICLYQENIVPLQPILSVQPTVLVELRSNNDYTNDHYIPYPSKVRGLGSLIILTN